MKNTLVISADELDDPFDLIDSVIWEDVPDEHRWENHHAGVIKRNGKYWMLYWTTGLTEIQEDRFFEDEIENGVMTLHEAESYEITVKKWRIK